LTHSAYSAIVAAVFSNRAKRQQRSRLL